MKILTMITLVLLLTGCATHPRNTLGKHNDALVKSPCGDCQNKPFYVNGRWK